MNLQLSKNRDGLEQLDLADKVSVRMVSFDKELRRLNKEDFLPRYNTVTLTIDNKSDNIIDDILLTIFRTHSRIGADNYHTLLIKTYGLKPETKGKYRVKIFDWFNEKFEGIEVRLATIEDWSKRKRIEDWSKKERVDGWINAGSKISERIDKGLLKLFR